MLSARKVQLLAGLKVHGLELRNRELDFYMIRFTMTAGLSSIMTCLSYVGLIKIKIPEPMHEGFYWQVATFYVCTSLSMVLSLYNLVLTSFSMVQGQASRARRRRRRVRHRRCSLPPPCLPPPHRRLRARLSARARAAATDAAAAAQASAAVHTRRTTLVATAARTPALPRPWLERAPTLRTQGPNPNPNPNPHQGLALRGPPGSLAKAVGIFQEQYATQGSNPIGLGSGVGLGAAAPTQQPLLRLRMPRRARTL